MTNLASGEAGRTKAGSNFTSKARIRTTTALDDTSRSRIYTNIRFNFTSRKIFSPIQQSISHHEEPAARKKISIKHGEDGSAPPRH